MAPYAEAVALGVVVAGITVLSIILGELVPKSIGLRYPESIASWVARADDDALAHWRAAGRAC